MRKWIIIFTHTHKQTNTKDEDNFDVMSIMIIGLKK